MKEKNPIIISPKEVLKGYKKDELNWKLKKRKWPLKLKLCLYFIANVED